MRNRKTILRVFALVMALIMLAALIPMLATLF